MTSSATLEAQWERLLVCPCCTGDLRAEPPGAAARLVCRGCARAFPVDGGIVRFIGDGETDQPVEMEQRDLEALSYEGMFPAWESFVELSPLARDLAAKPSDWVLEVGAGTGRVVREYIRDAAGVIAVDFSLSSLRYLIRSLALIPEARGKVVVVQADACALPVRKGVVDGAISVSVLQHLPSARHRARAVAEMVRALRGGGRLVVQVRHWSRIHALLAAHRNARRPHPLARRALRSVFGASATKRTEIHADGRISLYKMTSEELRDLVEQAGVRVERVVGRIFRAPGMQRFGSARPAVEHAIELCGLSRLASQEVVAVGTKLASESADFVAGSGESM